MFAKKQLLINSMLVILGLGLGVGAIYAVKADTCSVQSTFYRDADGDGYGNPAVTVTECSQPSGYVTDKTDCNDNNKDLHPGAAEACDFTDNDCNGSIDEGLATSTYYYDFDLDGYGYTATTTIACKAPEHYTATSSDCNDYLASTHPYATETCNGVDDDCDGTIDENATSTYYRDADGDGYGDADVTVQACSAPTGYISDKTDCNDSNASVNPGRSELNNGIDDDCDGTIDEGYDTHTYYRDTDGDGYGISTDTVTAATKPSGYAAVNSDCNDSNSAIHPGATEICDSKDNDCDGTVDESGTKTYYRDYDGDGYGGTATTTTACGAPAGYVENNTDCNDYVNSIHPGATEICDSKDNDCDGTVDENCTGNGDNNGNNSCDCGCTYTNGKATCNGQYKNNGMFVSCLSHFTNWLKKSGEITGREKGQIMSGHTQTGDVNITNNISITNNNYGTVEVNKGKAKSEHKSEQQSNGKGKKK